MPVSEAQKKASVKYLEKLDEVRIRMPKGHKATIQAHAEARGESVNGFINRAILETMERDSGTSVAAEGDSAWKLLICRSYVKTAPSAGPATY